MKLSEIIPNNEQSKIQDLIDKHNTTNEFEVSLFSSIETSESLLTMEKFDNLISILTIIGERENVKPVYENTLDISLSIKSQKTNFIAYRITIYDIEQINEYLEMLHQRKNSLVFSVLIGFIFDKNNISKKDKIY